MGLPRESADSTRGPDIDLLLVASGRRATLATLDGPGVATLSGRLH
ncbi:MAG: hypothetical protein L0H64_23595 [Pseudonocardia sp.]|nr:hypothetical protein [Pseudonocardia sp.]